MTGNASGLTQLIDLFPDIRRHVIHVVGRMGKNGVDGQQQVFLQHPLDDVFRRAYHIKIFVPFFDLGQHDFVDIESLIDNTNILACLLLIICLEIFQHSVADVIGPVINFQYLFAGLTGIVTTGKHKRRCKAKSY